MLSSAVTDNSRRATIRHTRRKEWWRSSGIAKISKCISLKQNYARLRSSWADLDVRERRQLRKAVHLSEIARNTALLEVTGMSEWNERLFFFRFAGPPSKPSHFAQCAPVPRTLAGKEVHVVVMSAVRRTFLCVNTVASMLVRFFFSLTNAFSEVCPSGAVV